MDLLALLQDSAPATFLRLSWWAYPLVNVLHLLGLAALFGAILVLDLRMLGVWDGTDRDVIAGPAVRVASAGLAVAAISGIALFAVRAEEYVEQPVFWAKIAFVVLGTVNAAAGRASGWDRHRPKLVAGLSLFGWTGAILFGRLIGYAGS